MFFSFKGVVLTLPLKGLGLVVPKYVAALLPGLLSGLLPGLS
jgi:hypothetical protein